MPTIPSYDSQGQIKSGPVAAMRNEATRGFESNQVILGAMQKVTQQWSEAHDVMQYTRRKNAMNEQITQVQLEAARDKNFENMPKYAQMIEDIRTSAAEGIDNKFVASKFQEEVNFNTGIAKIKVDAQFKEKEIKFNYDVFGLEADRLTYEIVNASSEEVRKQKQSELDELVALQIQSKVVSKQEMPAILYSAKYKAAKNSAQYSPEELLEKIDSYGLNKKDRDEVYSTAVQMKNRITKEELKIKRDTQRANAIEYVKLLFTPGQAPMSTEKVTSDIGSEVIPIEFGKAYTNAIISDKITWREERKDKKANKFIPFAQSIIDSGDEDAIIALITDVLNGGADGKINQDELGYLLKLAVQMNAEILSGTKSGFSAGAKAAISYTDNQDVQMDAIQNYVDEIDSGTTPDIAGWKAYFEAAKKVNPSLADIGPEGKTMQFPDGTVAIIYPDKPPKVLK